MSTIVTGDHPRRYVPGVLKWYGHEYGQYPATYEKFFSSMTSDKSFEDIVSMAGTGIMTVKPQGQASSSDNMFQGTTARLTPHVYAKQIALTMEAMADDQYNPKIESLVGKNFGKSERHTKEVVAHNVLNNGFSTVSSITNMYNNPDGKALLATDHLLAKGGTFSNKLAVDADLSQASIEQLIIQIDQWTDDAGIRIPVKAKQLLVSSSDRFNAMRLLMSEKESGTANNDINTLKVLGLELIVSPYLTDSDAYFITTDCENGLIMLNRTSPKIDADNDFDTKNKKFDIITRFAVGYADARCIVGSQGA